MIICGKLCFIYFTNGADIFPKALAVVIEIKYSARFFVKLITRCGVVKILHRLLDFLLNGSVLGRKIKRTVFKNKIFTLGYVHDHHLRRNFTGIAGRQPYTVSLGKRNSPTANSALWLVDKCYDLTVEAVVIFSADVIKLALYAVKETADGFAVLTGVFFCFCQKSQ